jgi:hypothetical protein
VSQEVSRIKRLAGTALLLSSGGVSLLAGGPVADPVRGPASEPPRPGKPATGARGITETVDAIMERQRFTGREPARPDLEREEARGRPFTPAPDPLAPAVASWPPPAKSGGPAASSPGASHLDPSDFSFRAVSTAAGESPFIPPDSMGDVGPTQIFVHVNGRLKVFDKNGVPGAINSNNNNFWESVRAGQRVTDPEVRYDRLSGRWFLAIVNLATVNNLILVAVSSGPEIAGSTSFTFFSFPVGIGGSGEDANICDYPSLGVDAQALYIGCDMYDTGGAYRHSTAYVIRKSSLLSGGPIVVTPFANITGGATAGPFSPRGVDNDDAQATEGYFIGTDVALLSRLVIRRVLDPGGTPSLSGNINLTVPTTSLPLLQVALGSTTSLDTFDDRLFMGAIHTNKITGVDSLWTAQHIGVDGGCVGASAGAGRRNGARWYEIGDLGGTPSLVQAGTLCDQAASNPRGFIYPSVIGTGQGHMVLGASFAAANSFIGAATASRSRDDSPGSLQAPFFPQPGLASYTLLGGGFNRWGDYSFTAVDPNDDMSVWTIQEYADTPANNWAVRVIQLLPPPPPAPSAATPSGLCTNSGPVAVTAPPSSIRSTSP